MKFDDILREIGEFGRYQKWIYFYTCIPALSVGAFILLNVIVFGISDHRCKIPGLVNDTWDVKSIEHRDLVNYYIPPSDTYPYDRCHLYIRDNSTVEKSENVPMAKCKEWVFDPSVFKNTLVKQMNLVCDDALMISHAQTVFYAGVLVGNLVFGQLSDLIGRKKTLFSGLMILMASSISLAFVTEYYSFVVIYFIVGTCTVSSLVTAYVIGMEFVGPSKRVWAGYVIMAFCTTGSLYLILMSFLLRDWKLIELSVGIPCIAYIFVICIIPESPRWLLSNGRREEAEHIVVKMAKRNGKCLTDEQLNLLEAEQQVSNGRLWQLFSTRKLALQTLVIFFNWFVVSMAYYGVILNVGNLGGDLYLNLFLITIVEYPGRLISIALLNRIGRKKCYIGFMLLGGIACIGTIYPVVQKDGGLLWLQVTLSVVGKMCVSSGFEVIYILSTELFPTVVRNVGLGTSSACARAGSMVSPYIAQLAGLVDSNVAAAIPLTVFGIAAFLGGLLSLSLPETLDKKLPETIEDAHNLNRKRDQVIVVQAPEKVPNEYKQLLRKKTAES